ncbi:MAG TPA: c-type cytochrome [Acidobacteriaceae bacterium]|nr:c-type cytochrome [Acidobacteriaceae bacterium]
MNRYLAIPFVLLSAIVAGCSHRAKPVPALRATAAGSALVVSSGDKQLGTPGSPLPQPLVVQVNDDQGNGVPGALVKFSGPAGVVFDPAIAISDSNGQVTASLTLPDSSGRYEITAGSTDKKGQPLALKVSELAAGYQQLLGYQLQRNYCSRCHDPDSTPEQVSNYDNLAVKPHAFEQGDTFNKLSDADLTAIVGHGGPALNLSALMPAYGGTLSDSDIRAVVAYIRLVSDPPYQPPGLVYARR